MAARLRPIPEEMPAYGLVLWAPVGAAIRGAGRLAFRLRIERQAELPAGSFVLASNHFSHLDPPLVASAIDRPLRFVALENLTEESRLLRIALAPWGTIPMSRANRSVATVRAALRYLERGGVVGVFPEARRVGHWSEVIPKRGAAWLAVRAAAPLVPVAILGTNRVFGMDNRLRRGRVRLVVGAPMKPATSEPDPVGELMARWEEWVSRQVS